MRHFTTPLILATMIGLGCAAPPKAMAGPGRSSATDEIYWGRKDMDRGHWTGALSHFRKALSKEPNRSETYAEIGRAYRRLGDVLRSKEAYVAALKLNPHNDEAETGLHDVMTPAEHERMMTDIEARVKAAPQDADLQATYAEELFERDRIDEAQKAATTALALNGKESHAEGVLGLIAARQNRPDEAIRFLSAATKADDSDDDSWAALGDIYSYRKDFPLAVDCYRHAVRAAPDHAEWHEKLATALTSAGDISGAATETEAARSVRADATR